MDTQSYKTKYVNAATSDKKWVIIDAEGQVLGRVCSQIAKVLRGKHKPSFSPHVDCGDNVIVINASKVRLTGQKWTAKDYIWYTGYPGGQRSLNARDFNSRDGRRLIEWGVKGMLPKNRLGSQLYRNMFVYADAEHPHEGQQPEAMELPYDTKA